MEKTDISLENELNQLDIAVNEKIKYCGWETLDRSDNALTLVMDIKNVLLLMTSEINSLNLRILKMENEIKEINYRGGLLK